MHDGMTEAEARMLAVIAWAGKDLYGWAYWNAVADLLKPIRLMASPS